MDNVGFRLGIELDVALPFGEGLWSGLFEPAYQTFSGEFGTVKAKYTSIDLHLGLRRYFPVGKGRLYLNSSLLYSQPSATLSGLAVNADVSSTFSLALSAGYKANRLSMELYFAVPRNITRSSSTYQTTFGGPAVILGYALK